MRELNSVENMMVSGGDIVVNDGTLTATGGVHGTMFGQDSSEFEGGVSQTMFTNDGWSEITYTDGTIMIAAPNGTQTFYPPHP